MKTCKNCHTGFEITDKDQVFHSRISPIFNNKQYKIPKPKLCPQCRIQRRMAFRNEHHFYKRKCDLTGESIISVNSSDKPYQVFDHEKWWTNSWDQHEHAMEVDFSRPFMEQIKELIHKTPHASLITTKSENSYYTHMATYNKDCYMLVCGSENERCLYSYWMESNKDCTDCFGLTKCELCYESINLRQCYQLYYSEDCRNCQLSWWLKNCNNCEYCVGCVNLRNKKHHWLNQPLSEEEYKNRLQRLLGDPVFRKETKDAYQKLLKESYFPWAHQHLSENCNGDYIQASKNCEDCYDIRDCEDCQHTQFCYQLKDSSDVTYFGFPGELLYECNNVGRNAYYNLFCNFSYESQHLLYCFNTQHSKNCFGCVNMHKQQYCILNRQYSKEEYDIMVSKIIEHMLSVKLEFLSIDPEMFLSFLADDDTVNDVVRDFVDVIRKTLCSSVLLFILQL